MMDEMELVRRLGEVEPLPPEVSERTEVVLRAAMALASPEQPVSGDVRALPVHPEEDGVPNRSTQRARRVLAAAAVAAVVAGGGAVLASGAGSPARHTAATGGAPTSPAAATLGRHIETAAYVVDHLKAAVDGNTAVLVTLAHGPNAETGQPVTTETWSSATSPTTRSEVLDAAGNPVSGDILTVSAKQTTAVHINYEHRTWSTRTYPFGSSSSSSAPAPLPETPDQTAAQLQAAVRTGAVTVVGTATVDGQRAIELRQVVAADGAISAGVMRTWVDPTTYLPLREVDTSSGQRFVTDYRWLPDTSANRRLLTATAAIPAGFTQVAG